MVNAVTKTSLPFSMLFVDLISHKERGYEIDTQDAMYDPITQIVPVYAMGGGTSPTTYSNTGSTGVISTDTDESRDDTGSD